MELTASDDRAVARILFQPRQGATPAPVCYSNWWGGNGGKGNFERGSASL